MTFYHQLKKKLFQNSFKSQKSQSKDINARIIEFAQQISIVQGNYSLMVTMQCSSRFWEKMLNFAVKKPTKVLQKLASNRTSL